MILHEYLCSPKGCQAVIKNNTRHSNDATEHVYTSCSNASCSNEERERQKGASIGRGAEEGRDRSGINSERRAAAQASTTCTRRGGDRNTSCSSDRRCCSWWARITRSIRTDIGHDDKVHTASHAFYGGLQRRVGSTTLQLLDLQGLPLGGISWLLTVAANPEGPAPGRRRPAAPSGRGLVCSGLSGFA